jgi:hypothetical protein
VKHLNKWTYRLGAVSYNQLPRRQRLGGQWLEASPGKKLVRLHLNQYAGMVVHPPYIAFVVVAVLSFNNLSFKNLISNLKLAHIHRVHKTHAYINS